MSRHVQTHGEALRLRGMSVSPPGAGAPLLRDLSLEVARGETVALVGRSGAGKSLTIRTLLGLVPGTWQVEGEVAVGGHAVDPGRPEDSRQRRLRDAAVVLQDPRAAFNPLRTIGDFVTEAARERGAALAAAEARAIELLEEVGLPAPRELLTRYPHELSGGMLQRVAIAAALSGEPALLVADEPTASLDVLSQAEVIAALERAQAQHGFGLLLVMHDVALAASVADRVAVLGEGRIVEHLDPAALEAAEHPISQALVGAAQPHAPRGPGDRQRHAQAPPAVVARDLVRRYGSTVALDGVSLSIARGATLAVVGGSGSGKSTLARLITGLERPDAGSVDAPRAVGALSFDPSPAALRVQMVFQDPALSLDPRLSARRAVERALAAGSYPRAGRRDEALRLLASVGIDAPTAARRPAALSGGQCQRVSIARALALRPELLVLDEATSALDPEVREQVLALVDRLREKLDLAVLLITHDLSTVARLADEVVVLHRGRVVESGRAAAMLAAPQSDYGRLLLDALPRRGWRPEHLARRRRALEAGSVDVRQGGGAQGAADELQRA